MTLDNFYQADQTAKVQQLSFDSGSGIVAKLNKPSTKAVLAVNADV